VSSPTFTGIIAFKGGVGKTVLSASLGIGLSYMLKRRVLLVDLDPQANLSEVFLTETTLSAVIKKAFETGRVFSFDLIIRPSENPIIYEIPGIPGLYLLPSHHKFMREAAYGINVPMDRAVSFRGILGRLTKELELDHVIIDFPPQMYQYVITIAAASADYIVTPVAKGAFSIPSVGYLIETYYDVAKVIRREPSVFLGAILIRYDEGNSKLIKLSRERVKETVSKFFKNVNLSPPPVDPVFDTVLYYNPLLTKIRGQLIGSTPYIVKHILGKYTSDVSRRLQDRLKANIASLVREFEERLNWLAALEKSRES